MNGGLQWIEYTASWVAIFVLLIIWWLSYVPRIFTSRSTKPIESQAVAQSGMQRESSTTMALDRTVEHYREGLLFLLTAVVISFTLGAPPYASNALAWVFTAIWILLGIYVYFGKSGKIVALLQFADLVLIIALISNAFARPDSTIEV